MKNLRFLIKLWLPLVFWCGLIFYFSSVPNLKTASNPFWDEIIRDMMHFAVYFILYILFFRGLNFQKKKRNYWRPLILTFLYSLSDEIHQSFVPTRTFQWRDLLIDAAGAISGTLGIRSWLPMAPKKVKFWIKRWGII